MSSTGDSGTDPFSFFEDEKQPSWYQLLFWDLHEFLVKSFGLDPYVWMGRIVVSLVLMLAWDAYWAPPKKPKRERQQAQKETQKEPPTREMENTRNASESLENPSETQSSLLSSEQLPGSKEKEETSDPITETIPLEESNPTKDTATKESQAKVTDNTSKIDKPKGIAASSTESSRSASSNSNSNSASASSINPWATRLDGFHYWYEVETSLYRIYTLAHRDSSIPTIPPYLANSKRGNVAVAMRVTNRTNRDINVYWVDYKGKHIPKGRISKHSGVWTQTTWIDHPWVMEDANTGTLLLYFVPYKVIPTIPVAPTVGPDGRSGLFAFDITEVDTQNTNSDYWVGISDKALPYPPLTHFDTPLKAIHWTLQHLSRHSQASRTDCFAVETATLQKYLLNIMNDPTVWKYRNLKLSSKHFAGIWNSPLRGLLLAVGFVEDRGYCTLGVSDSPLSSDKVQEIALLSYLLNEWTRKNTGSNPEGEQQQPIGAMDGYGRAGFGRAGTMG